MINFVSDVSGVGVLLKVSDDIYGNLEAGWQHVSGPGLHKVTQRSSTNSPPVDLSSLVGSSFWKKSPTDNHCKM